MARFRSRRPFSTRRAAFRAGFRIASACASLTLLLLCLFIAGPQTLLPPSAYAEPAASPTPTDTPAPPTATPIPPPSLTLVSPSSGQGPVGARMTLAGAHWTVSGVTIGVALAAADCDTPASWEQTIGFVTPKPTGALDYSFTWPAALPPVGAPYAICALATGLAPASVPYQVRSALPPTLSLSDAVVAPGQSVTVNGANFIGATSVDVNLIDPAGARRALGKQTPAADGSFSFSYTPKPADLGLVTVTATSPAEGGALPALAASVTVNVQSALDADRHAASHLHSHLRANQNPRWNSRAFPTNPRPARGAGRRADFSFAGAGWLGLRSLLPVARRTPTRGGAGAAHAHSPAARRGGQDWRPGIRHGPQHAGHRRTSYDTPVRRRRR